MFISKKLRKSCYILFIIKNLLRELMVISKPYMENS